MYRGRRWQTFDSLGVKFWRKRKLFKSPQLMVYTHIWGQRLCPSKKAYYYYRKKKNNIYGNASGLVHRTRSIKFHQVLEKFWRNTKPHLTFMPLCISLFHEGEFTDCKNGHVLWLRGLASTMHRHVVVHTCLHEN